MPRDDASATRLSAAFGLTRKQRDILLCIQELIALGESPSHVEISRKLDIPSKSEINRCLTALRDRGRIDWLPYRRRSLRVLHPIPTPEEPAIELTEKGWIAGWGVLPVRGVVS